MRPIRLVRESRLTVRAQKQCGREFSLPEIGLRPAGRPQWRVRSAADILRHSAWRALRVSATRLIWFPTFLPQASCVCSVERWLGTDTGHLLGSQARQRILRALWAASGWDSQKL